eukprot:gb/GEZN01007308.1/.p2 GENE.gb/GEZN01007308.1/~~gb/GEZN01007308.1/.p2  ORF type:complete len:185 (+),score=15.43 gb/GEZN01007308.1/:210-764(+)
MSYRRGEIPSTTPAAKLQNTTAIFRAPSSPTKQSHSHCAPVVSTPLRCARTLLFSAAEPQVFSWESAFLGGPCGYHPPQKSRTPKRPRARVTAGSVPRRRFKKCGRRGVHDQIYGRESLPAICSRKLFDGESLQAVSPRKNDIDYIDEDTVRKEFEAFFGNLGIDKRIKDDDSTDEDSLCGSPC